MPSVYALVVAAGQGSRFGGLIPKQYLPLAGADVLRHAVSALAGHPRIANVLVAIRPEDRALFDRSVVGLGVPSPVIGGATRQDSVRLGLEALVAYCPDRVLIHDGARPFPSQELVDRIIDGLDRSLAAIPCLPLSDTVKRVEGGTIRETIDRSALWRAQTPQGFHFDAILAAHRAADGHRLTDDAAVAEAAGLIPLVVEGSEDNLKITTSQDLAVAERMVAARLGDVRVGQGFDVHPFAPGDHVWICGIKVPHSMSLAGHSDADVGLHALTDAVLGAIGAGDIGMHFPPTDPRWRGAASDQFLRRAVDLVRAQGGVVAAVDVTIVCERPRITQYREAMVERVATILRLTQSRVSVKATTTEKLGFTGRAEGIAAQAVATIRLPL
jgi:2-C-methyl-D-erythritol 4-phosphate cytidylyltransferase/2-C-methyl-D-erythritol 2,4-cyclodiphosphate synthase